MEEILANLQPGSRVLDLGCGAGSFQASAYDVRVVRLDREGGTLAPASVFVRADATTLCDCLYRWLACGGGHVNAFRSVEETVERIGAATGLECVATRALHTSFHFFNRRNARGPLPRMLWLIAGGNEALLRWLSLCLRVADRIAGIRLSVYGWALWFVAVRPRWPVSCYRCPACGADNWLTVDGRSR